MYGAGMVDDAAELILRFVNTRADGAGRSEGFGTAAAFAAWAAETGLLPADAVVTESDAAAARELREALVTLLLTHAADGTLDAAQVADAERYLLQAGVRYPLRTVVTATGARLVAESAGVPRVLGTVLAAATEVAQHGDWGRIKACCNPPCHFGFLDRTRNRAARYCSPGCGSQVSMRAMRERRRASPS
jgi:predicted RNA-binding Zn ribbon-like protein